MPKVLLNGTGGSSIGNTTTRYTPVFGAIQAGTTEGDAQVPFRTAGGTITNLTCNVSANTTTANSTFRLRVNGANVNNSISVGAGTTGQFEDTSSSDTIAQNDQVNYSYVGGGGGSYTLASIGCTFASSGNTFARLCACGQLTVTYALSNATAYVGLGRATLEQTTEAIVGTKIRASFTASNLLLRVTSNARATSTVIKSRKNSADGNMSVSVATLTTGTFEDTSNTDSLSSGDVFDFSILGGVEVTNFVFSNISVELVSTGSDFCVPATNNAPGSVGAGNTRFFGLGGNIVPNAGEANVQNRVNFSFTAAKLFFYVAVNAAGTGTGRLRINTGNSALSVSVGSGATGLFEDTTNTQAFVDNDTIAFSYAAVTSAQTLTAWGIHGSSTSVFNESVSESMALAETVSAAAIFASDVAEAMALADTVSSLAIFASTVSEALALTETISAAAIFGSSVAETLALGDTQSTTVIFGSAVTESIALVDAVTSTGTFSAQISETITLIDAVSIQVSPTPPIPSQPGGGGSGAAGHRRRQSRVHPSHSNQKPDSSLPRKSSDFEGVLSSIIDEDDICDVLTAFLQVKDRRR